MASSALASNPPSYGSTPEPSDQKREHTQGRVMNVSTKLTCVGIGLSMCIQNYSFFLGFWNQYSKIGMHHDCEGVRWWLGYDALVCWIESFFCLGMMLGAVWDGPRVLFWIFFVLHLIDAVPGYTFATIFLFKDVNSDEFARCAGYGADPVYHGIIDTVKTVSFSQFCFGYIFYVCFMLALVYLVVFKKKDEEGPFLDEIDQDKLVIFVIGLMMMVQNSGFGLTYWDLFTEIGAEPECHGTRWWLAYDAIVCALETTFAGCMVLGGWIADKSKIWFGIFWVLHAIDAVPGYTFSCIFLGTNLLSDDGLKCTEKYPSAGERAKQVWIVQLTFYVFYIFCMLGITYTSVIKDKKPRSAKLLP